MNVSTIIPWNRPLQWMARTFLLLTLCQFFLYFYRFSIRVENCAGGCHTNNSNFKNPDAICKISEKKNLSESTKQMNNRERIKYKFIISIIFKWSYYYKKALYYRLITFLVLLKDCFTCSTLFPPGPFHIRYEIFTWRNPILLKINYDNGSI